MKICLVSQDYPPETARGGISTQTWNKANALRMLGHEVSVISKAPDGHESDVVSQEGVRVIRIKPPSVDFPVYTSEAYWLGYSWCVFGAIHKLLGSGGIDILDFAEYGAEGFAYQVDRTMWNWIPILVQLHGPLAMCSDRFGWPHRESNFHRVGTFLEGVTIRKADRMMACSQNIADYVSSRYDVPVSSIDVVHCGVDATLFHPGQGPWDAASVLFVGNVEANKGVETVFEAVLLLRRKRPNLRLDIVGSSESGLLRQLARRAAAEPSGSFLEIHGFVDHARLPDYYRRAAVFASPASHENGVANVYLEAMACGCPVIASSAGGGPEAVVHGETGWIVPPNDVQATAEVLEGALADTGMIRRMGVAARRRIEEYFCMERYIERVLKSYERCIQDSRLRRQKMESNSAYRVSE